MIPDDGMINGKNYTGLSPFPVIQGVRDAQAYSTTTMFENAGIVSWSATTIVVLILYSRLFFIMRTIVQNSQSNRQRQSASALSVEFRLLAYGIIVVIMQGSTAILQLLLKYYGFNTWYVSETAMVGLNCYSNPYFLLALSTPLRERFLAFLKIRKMPNAGNFVVTMNAQSVQRNQTISVVRLS